MSFIRTKEIPPGSGNLYDYEVEATRENGKVRQKVIRYLGKHTAESFAQFTPSKLPAKRTRKNNKEDKR